MFTVNWSSGVCQQLPSGHRGTTGKQLVVAHLSFGMEVHVKLEYSHVMSGPNKAQHTASPICSTLPISATLIRRSGCPYTFFLVVQYSLQGNR
jgi:hypothetical protein